MYRIVDKNGNFLDRVDCKPLAARRCLDYSEDGVKHTLIKEPDTKIVSRVDNGWICHCPSCHDDLWLTFPGLWI